MPAWVRAPRRKPGRVEHWRAEEAALTRALAALTKFMPTAAATYKVAEAAAREVTAAADLIGERLQGRPPKEVAEVRDALRAATRGSSFDRLVTALRRMDRALEEMARKRIDEKPRRLWRDEA